MVRQLILAGATLSLLGLLAACGGGGGEKPSATTVPGVTGTPGEATFPVILEHDTRVVAAADGSDIREEPVPYQPRASAGEGEASLDGRLRATFRDGTLFVQEGDGEPEVIAEVPSNEEFASVVWSPDGRRLVVDVSFDGSSASLYLVNVDGSGLVDIGQGLEGDALAFQAFWSPDSQRVAFGMRSSPSPEATHRMHVAQADGTETTPLGEYSGYHGWEGGSDLPAWSPDGTRIGVFSPEGGMRVLDASGGPAVDIRGSQAVSRFSWSPDSRLLAFDNETDGLGSPSVVVWEVATAQQRTLTEGHWPRWSPDGGRIAFKRGNEVFTILLDGSGVAALGDLGSNDRGELTWSEDGAELEFVRGTSSIEYLYTVDLRTATATRSPTSLTENGFGGTGETIELSPNGTRVAFPVQSGKEDQYAPGWFVMDIVSGDVTQATDDPRGGDVFWTDEGFRLAFSAGTGGVFVAEGDRSPSRQVSDTPAQSAIIWSPDGKYLAIATAGGIELIDVDGPDDRMLVSGLDRQSETIQRVAWSPDGTALSYEVSHNEVAAEMTWQRFVIDLDGSPPRRLLGSETGLLERRWSPNGETIAFVRADETGAELRLVDAGGGNERLLTRFAGVNQSLARGTASSAGSLIWSPDGTKIATVLSGTDLYVIDVETGDATLTAVNASYCLMALLGWSSDSETIYVIPQCALGGI